MSDMRAAWQETAGVVEGPPQERLGIHGALLSAAQRYPDKTAVVDGQTRMSFGELATEAQGLQRTLARRGVRPGDRVAILLSKSVEAVIALYGTWMAGGVAVPVNETLKNRQVDHILRHSGSRVLISSDRALAKLDPEVVQGLALVEVTKNGHHPPEPSHYPAPEHAAAILYTSGSTGRPKGIALSHENLVAGTRIVSSYLGLRSDDRLLSILPFSFDYGLNQLLTAVQVGATLVVQQSHLPADICRALVEHDITGCAGVPPMWIQLVSNVSPFADMQFPHLRYITNSGGKFPTTLLKRYRELIPHTQVFLMYGLSEAFRSTYLDPREVDVRPDSMGKAIPETEIYVLDSEGRECPPGVPGELVHSGPTVAIGYWNDPETTERVFRTVVLPGTTTPRRVVFSGDLVQRDEDGFLYFGGRRDHLIKSQGFRISPEEVEELLLSSGLVNEAAARGEPDELSGHIVIAHVVPKVGVADVLTSLEAFCRKEMPLYMQPRKILTHASLPRTSSGKIDRQRLASDC